MAQMIYRRPDLARLGIDYSPLHLRRLEAAGQFPKRFKLNPACTAPQGAVAWAAGEFDAWIRDRIACRKERPNAA